MSKFIPEIGRRRTRARDAATHAGEADRAESQTAKVLAHLMPAFGNKPVEFEPRAKWKYCQSGSSAADYARILLCTGSGTWRIWIIFDMYSA